MKPTNYKTHENGFSLLEAVVMVAVIGILASISVKSVGKITKASKETVAQNLVETLNNATKEFGHAQYKIVSNGEDNSSDDEVAILRTLQWKDPSIELGVAGPFMRNYVPAPSSSSDDYRVVWAGSFWKMARPGESGHGLKVNFEATDLANTYTHPSDFSPVKFTLDPDYVDSGDGGGTPLTGDDLVDALPDF